MIQLAEKLVDYIGSVDFQYRPRRGEYGAVVKSWPERLYGYRWGNTPEPFADFEHLKTLEEIFAPCANNLANGGKWSAADQSALITATQKLFTWGRVLRGNGHANPSIDTIERVIRTAIEYNDAFNAPMDSAWTKLAALSTAWAERPQVIFDSRVSVSLLRSIDAVCNHHPEMHTFREDLKANGLGYVPGRGGNRPEHVLKLRETGWRSGYRSWAAQFTASDLVYNMATVLNEKSEFGKMPTPDGSGDKWTTRGVEMVLFMDGY